MEKTIHAHEVLNLLGNFEKGISKEELNLILTQKFGKHFNFTNCSGDKYSFDEILGFMSTKNKITTKENKLFLNRQNLCHH